MWATQGSLERDDAAVGRFVAALGPSPVSSGVDSALDALRDAADADACELFVRLPDGDDAVLIGCASCDVDAFCSQECFAPGVGFPGIVIGTGVEIMTADVTADDRFLRRPVARRGYRGFACVPLARDDRVLGSLQLAWKGDAPAMERGLRLLVRASVPLAAAVAAEIGEVRSRAAAAPPRADAIAARLRTAATADTATVVIGDAPARTPEPVLCRKLASRGAGGCPACDVGYQLLREPRVNWPAPCRTLPEGYGCFVCLPLGSGKDAIAVLGYHDVPPAPATRHLPVAAAFAHALADAHAHPRAVGDDGPSAPLELRCLGPFEVRVHGRLVPVAAFGRAKALELLEMLALAGGAPVLADTLMERLWPGVAPELGARRLHVTVHALRRAIAIADTPSPIVRDGAAYRLDAAGHTSDLRELRRLVAAAHAAEAEMRRLEDARDLLARATALWRGELFASDPDADWCTADRPWYRRLYVDALVQLSGLATRLGGPGEAIEPLRRAIAVEPLREDLHQALLRALMFAGRHGEARAHYRELAAKLRDELGLAPDVETRRIAELAGCHG